MPRTPTRTVAVGDRTFDVPSHVSRVDNDRMNHWLVRVHRTYDRSGRRRPNPVTQRSFADSKHGGTAEALEAALAYRDRALGEAPPARSPAGQAISIGNSRAAAENAAPGVVGVNLQWRRNYKTTGRDEPRPYVGAYWVEGGERRVTSFSVSKHGARGATVLAARRRARNEAWFGLGEMTVDEIVEAALPEVEQALAAGPPVDPDPDGLRPLPRLSDILDAYDR